MCIRDSQNPFKCQALSCTPESINPDIQTYNSMLLRKLRLANILNTLRGKRVLIRVDYNIPLNNGKVKDASRIRATVPTINAVFNAGARSVVLMSHLGRPNGKRSEENSLRQIVKTVENLTKRPVTFIDDCVGPQAEAVCAKAKSGELILLENLRFHAEEEGPDRADGKKVEIDLEKIKDFRRRLTRLEDVFVNDAFGTAHRVHSSMVGIGLGVRAAGHLVTKELENFAKILDRPERPLVVIMGGSKVEINFSCYRKCWIWLMKCLSEAEWHLLFKSCIVICR
eukprot:TRINITY_DN1163_c0_g2_i2.p2 TRINITY_DN1163_c0_g2~~TRINITY_DN1163_c0_g2_i2.p2  ORF type:complete len:283 (+),score=23.99 TRINITY_DN1163_c0_g2_i2:73-921(+)